MYKYETHLHTAPVSRCASASNYETLLFYKKRGYDGVFITNHFLDGNINIRHEIPYKEKLDFYFSGYEDALETGREIGIKVFLGLEISFSGTDFLVYGLEKQWFYKNPQIMDMINTDELSFLMSEGAFILQTHPYREAEYINHIRLFPRSVLAVETINATSQDKENRMADIYAENYKLLKTAGSDNHIGAKISRLAGMETEFPIESEMDFISCIKNKEIELFVQSNA